MECFVEWIRLELKKKKKSRLTKTKLKKTKFLGRNIEKMVSFVFKNKNWLNDINNFVTNA